jgi:hypothetical protein
MSNIRDVAAKMKNKNQKMQVLKEELIKYSKQIGIIDCEIPELVFSRKEFDSKDEEVEDKPHLDIGSGRLKHSLGTCSISRRMIYVNMDWTPSKIWKETRRTKADSNGDVYVYYIKVPYGLREVRKTMIHELVHYRFRYMSDGKKLDDRVTDILRGKEYARKHIEIPAIGYE